MTTYKEFKANSFSDDDLREYIMIQPIIMLIKNSMNDPIKSKIIDEILVSIMCRFSELQWDYISESLLEADEYRDNVSKD